MTSDIFYEALYFHPDLNWSRLKDTPLVYISLPYFYWVFSLKSYLALYRDLVHAFLRDSPIPKLF